MRQVKNSTVTSLDGKGKISTSDAIKAMLPLSGQQKKSKSVKDKTSNVEKSVVKPVKESIKVQNIKKKNLENSKSKVTPSLSSNEIKEMQQLVKSQQEKLESLERELKPKVKNETSVPTEKPIAEIFEKVDTRKERPKPVIGFDMKEVEKLMEVNKELFEEIIVDFSSVNSREKQEELVTSLKNTQFTPPQAAALVLFVISHVMRIPQEQDEFMFLKSLEESGLKDGWSDDSKTMSEASIKLLKPIPLTAALLVTCFGLLNKVTALYTTVDVVTSHVAKKDTVGIKDEVFSTTCRIAVSFKGFKTISHNYRVTFENLKSLSLVKVVAWRKFLLEFYRDMVFCFYTIIETKAANYDKAGSKKEPVWKSNDDELKLRKIAKNETLSNLYYVPLLPNKEGLVDTVSIFVQAKGTILNSKVIKVPLMKPEVAKKYAKNLILQDKDLFEYFNRWVKSSTNLGQIKLRVNQTKEKLRNDRKKATSNLVTGKKEVTKAGKEKFSKRLGRKLKQEGQKQGE